MNIRCMLSARLAACMVLLAVLFLVPAAGHAQAVDCSKCDHFTFGVSNNMGCAVTICYTYSPEGPVFCQPVNHGRSISINCPVYQAWVNTCSGQYYIVPAAADVACSPDLKFADGCCGRICIAPSIDGCTRLEVQPAPCLTPGCP